MHLKNYDISRFISEKYYLVIIFIFNKYIFFTIKKCNLLLKINEINNMDVHQIRYKHYLLLLLSVALNEN